MDADDAWDEYHLVPTGWVMGASQPAGGPAETRATPGDRLLTVRTVGAKAWMVRETWRAADADAVAGGVRRFGPWPK